MDNVGGGFCRSCVCGGAVGFGLMECGFMGVRGFGFRGMDFVARRRG